MGVFSTQEAAKFGLSKMALSRLVKTEQLHRVRKGFYVHPESKAEPEHYDFVIACHYFGPSALIGGLTALFYHRLIEQVPKKTWVVVPSNQKTTASLYRCIRTKTNPNVGVEEHKGFRISNLERTILEALRYSSKIGATTAIKAARTAIADGRTSEVRLGRLANNLGLRAVFTKYWDAIIA